MSGKSASDGPAPSLNQVAHFVGGREVTPAEASWLEVYNPATGQPSGSVPVAGPEEVDEAVRVAAAAQAGWGATSLYRRSEIFFSIRNLVAQRADELARTITSEHGKILADARGEVARGLENLDFACGLVHLLKGSRSGEVSSGIDVEEWRHPLGVAVGISPFNFPAMVPLWMVCNAVASGNSFILKPSEKDPSPALQLALWFADAGLPEGVFNVLHGDASTVNHLIDHPAVAAVSSVGSTPVARQIYARAAARGKRVQALGGAKNHMVVLPDADLLAAADAAVAAAFGSAGERCMAISVLVAVGDIADALVDLVAERMGRLRVGEGTDQASQMGPLITREHRDRVASYLDIGRREGATVVVDGRAQQFAGNGFFLGASLLDRVSPGMQVYRDEIFGPVLCVVRVADYPKAIALVNENPYGNGAALFTRSGAAARRFCREADVGMVGINLPIPVPVGAYSFGGWRDSLFGDTHIYGPDGIRFFTRSKVVTGRWQGQEADAASPTLAFPTN